MSQTKFRLIFIVTIILSLIAIIEYGKGSSKWSYFRNNKKSETNNRRIIPVKCWTVREYLPNGSVIVYVECTSANVYHGIAYWTDKDGFSHKAIGNVSMEKGR